MNNKKYICILIFILTFSIFIYGLEEKLEPSWVYLKKAEILKEKGEYALAIIEARKSKEVYIKEKIEKYYEEIRELHKDKIEYELMSMTREKELELLQNDNYPQYHEIMGDLYVLTDFLDQAEKEYKKALTQSDFFDYKQKEMELKYKIAGIHSKRGEYELEDILYREIVQDYFNSKNKEYWNRIRININNDSSLNHVFRIYRNDGIEYLVALFKIGKRSALLQRKNDAIFYLTNAAIVWMTHYSQLIQRYNFDFQYSNPTDFINYFAKKKIYEYESEEYIIDEIFFYIGYIYQLENETEIMNHYYDLAIIFSENSKRNIDIKDRVEFLRKNTDHIIKYDEF